MSPPGNCSGVTTNESVVRHTRPAGAGRTAASESGARYSLLKREAIRSAMSCRINSPPPPWAIRMVSMG